MTDHEAAHDVLSAEFVDGAAEQGVMDAILSVIERGEDLGLIELDSTPSLNVTVESIPVADMLETGE